jgi:hypothetical protein
MSIAGYRFGRIDVDGRTSTDVQPTTEGARSGGCRAASDPLSAPMGMKARRDGAA